MSYSRRQLYAMGETFGDSATRMEAGGRIVYGGGGGGNKTVEPTTTITESGPTITERTTANEIPEYLTNASQDLVARGQALTSRPYEAYTGARVAEFSPLMNQAFQRMGSQQVAGQTTEATGLASLAGQRAMDYGQFQQGVQQYMNPYMQNVVDIERRKAQEASDQQSAMLSGQAAKQGAFGGSGAALQQRALRRDTAQQLADLQAQGLDRAYQSAVGQYNQGISSGLAASGQLAGLGQQQFGQEMDITKGLGTAGDVQRQREQALLDVGYGDYLTAQKYPYEQLAFQQSLVSGVPYSTTQRTSEVHTPGKQVQQRVTSTEAVPDSGPRDGNYADGGITSLLSDEQIDRRQQMPNISDLARMALQAKKEEYARIRADQQNMDAQQAMMDQGPEETVAGDEMRQIAAAREIAAARASGIAGLDGYEYAAAGGGIVAFANEGAVPAPVPAINYGLPAISTSLIPKAAQDLMAQQRSLAMQSANQEKLDAEASFKRVQDDIKALGDPYAKREERLKTQEGKFEGAEVSAVQNAFLRFGLEVLATKGEKDKAKALAKAGIGTLDNYGKEMDKVYQSQREVAAARDRLDELRHGNEKGNREAVRNAEADLNKAKRSATSAAATIFGEDAKTIINAYDKKLSRDAQYASANKPTNEREFISDWVKMKRDMGDTRPDSELRVEGAKNYPGAAASTLRASTAAGTAQINLGDKARDNVDKTVSSYSSPEAEKLRTLRKKDRDNEKAGVQSNLAADYMQTLYKNEEKRLGASFNPEASAPSAAPAPAAAPVSAPPPAAVNMLRQNPSDIAKRQFDAAFGPGAANRALAGR